MSKYSINKSAEGINKYINKNEVSSLRTGMALSGSDKRVRCSSLDNPLLYLLYDL